MANTTQQDATIEQAKKLGLREDEFELIKETLGRTPNSLELDIYSVAWSELCSNKNSIQWLNKLPKISDEFNGVINLGDEIGCSVKIEESSMLNGATFTQGEQSISQINVFYFGDLQEKGVKQSIKNTLNDIKGHTSVFENEVYFSDRYNSESITRQFSAGIIDINKVIPAKAADAGNSVFIVGNDINSKQREALQEAIAELAESDAVIGIKNIGLGGIALVSAEMIFSQNVGIDIWIDKVDSKQRNVDSTKISTSDTNGLIVVVKKGNEKLVKEIFEKRGLNTQEIGIVTDKNNVRFIEDESLIADLPSKSLVRGEGAPQYERDFEEPSYYQKFKKFDIDKITQPEDLKKIAIFLLKHQNIASKNWFNSQLNSTVGSQKMTSDATLISLDGTKKVLALSVGYNSRYLYADPHQGTAITVAQAAIEIICSGGTPIATTHNIDFGNPYNPEHYWQFTGVIKGMSEVCSKFQCPISEGKVSFDKNALNDKPFYPTPTIGLIGVAHKENTMSLDFKYKGDLIFILGENIEDIGSSEYLASYHNIQESPAPYFNLDKAFELQETLKQLIKTKYVNAVHNVSEGGIFISLAEMGMTNELGFDIVTDAEVREDAFLFGEAAGRVIVTVTEDYEDEFIEFMMNSKTQFTLLGHVTKGKMVIDDEHYGFIKEAKDIYENALELYIEK